MKITDVIIKKRDGNKLNQNEIDFFVHGYTQGIIPDYQAAALLMAIFINGMDQEETLYLTQSMVNAGEKIDLTAIPGKKIDKHSTGGVGDKISLIVGPVVAACGVPFAKMSGEGLGYTGGTIDKLRSIPGFETGLSVEEFKETVRKTGMSIIEHDNEICKPDKLIYGLRNATATVGNDGLIASSIMSKKIATGCDGLILDVKCGKGAFEKDIDQGEILAKLMVDIGQKMGIETIALLTNMDEPLGNAVGNSAEVVESIEVLKGAGPSDVRELVFVMAKEILLMAGKAKDSLEAENKIKIAINSGAALGIFKDFIKFQGGDSDIVDDISLLPRPAFALDIKAKEDGIIGFIDGETVGIAAQLSGAGRFDKMDSIDYSAGILLNKKVGDEVKTGDILARIFGNDKNKVVAGGEKLEVAYTIGKEAPEKKGILLKKITKEIQE